jgi:hypothetical protein
VQVEAVAPRLERLRGLDPRGIGIGAQALDPRAGAGAERYAALHGRAGEPGERERLGRQRIGGVGIVADPTAGEQRGRTRRARRGTARGRTPGGSAAGAAR